MCGNLILPLDRHYGYSIVTIAGSFYNAPKDFFEFNFEIRSIVQTIYSANMQSAVYDAFYRVMMPQYGANAEECYQARFYSYGLFGLLDEWVKRGFKETPDEMVRIFYAVMDDRSDI